MKKIYVIGTMKEILTIDDLGAEGIETFESEEEVKTEHKKYSIYIEDDEDINGDIQYRYESTKLI